MSLAPMLPRSEATNGAGVLARALPALRLQARQVAASVLHGWHGRRRAGIGDQFWQYRPYVTGDMASQIDWRRSAKASQVLLRQREWQAAQKVWLWLDGSLSMQFSSSANLPLKRDCADVLGLALADMLVRGGERVGLIGQTRLLARGDIIERFGAALAEAGVAALPPLQALEPGAQAVWISDFLQPLDLIEAHLAILAGQGAHGTLLMIADPQEELFPFEGHVEFRAHPTAARLRFGQAELARTTYLNELAAHKERLRQSAARFGWTLTQHRTDRPMAGCLLGLSTQLGLRTGAN